MNRNCSTYFSVVRKQVAFLRPPQCLGNKSNIFTAPPSNIQHFQASVVFALTFTIYMLCLERHLLGTFEPPRSYSQNKNVISGGRKEKCLKHFETKLKYNSDYDFLKTEKLYTIGKLLNKLNRLSIICHSYLLNLECIWKKKK